jgi:hypothetical protein
MIGIWFWTLHGTVTVSLGMICRENQRIRFTAQGKDNSVIMGDEIVSDGGVTSNKTA